MGKDIFKCLLKFDKNLLADHKQVMLEYESSYDAAIKIEESTL